VISFATQTHPESSKQPKVMPDSHFSWGCRRLLNNLKRKQEESKEGKRKKERGSEDKYERGRKEGRK
jgi:hypothetical protein